MIAVDVRELVFEHLDGVRESSGDELTAVCPWCGRPPEHFYINGITGRYICFGCNEKGGSVAGVIAEVMGIPILSVQRMLIKRSVKFGTPRRKEEPRGLLNRVRALRGHESDDDEEVDFELPSEFVQVFDGHKWRMPTYLLERGFTRRAARRFGVGFCSSGRYVGRIVLPIVCPAGRSFTARDTTGYQKRKYINPPDAKHGRLLYGWYEADDSRLNQAVRVIVEGPLDVMRLWQYGLRAYGIFGNRISPGQLALLRSWPRSTIVVVMLDPGEEEGAAQVAQQSAILFPEVRIGRLPGGVDPGASTRVQALAAVVRSEKFEGGASASVRVLRWRVTSNREPVKKFGH